jgi:hypothetical protein
MKGIWLRAMAAYAAAAGLVGCGATPHETATGQSVHEAWFAELGRAEAEKDALDRCLAVPDPQGYKWPEDLLRALCEDHRKPVANAGVLRPLIDRADWPALRAHYDRYLDRHYRRADPELLLHRAFPKASWKSREQEDDYTNRWLKAAPDDPYAHLLRARYLIDQAWETRGPLFASEVPDDQMQRAQALASEANLLAKRAADLEPRLLLAYNVLISSAAFIGGRQQRTTALLEGLHHSPQSYYLRASALHFLQPKWGGSPEQMDHLVEQAQKHLKENPRLILLRVERASFDGDEYSARKQYGPRSMPQPMPRANPAGTSMR